jgi:hypothetical protein
MDNEFYNVMNRTMYAKHMECAVSPLSDIYMTCNFVNDRGIAAEINNVSVYHIDVANPQLDVHRDKSTGETIIAVQSNETMACDVMGEWERGVPCKWVIIRQWDTTKLNLFCQNLQ